jgi:hypothetical protein
VPVIELALQCVTLSQQLRVIRAEVVDQHRHRCPELFIVNRRAGSNFGVHEFMEETGDGKARKLNTFSHIQIFVIDLQTGFLAQR